MKKLKIERNVKMNCNEFNEKISFYIDDELSEYEKKEFEIHLCSCKNCKKEYEDMIYIVKSLKNMEDKPLPNNYDEILRSKLEKEKKKVYNKVSYKKYLSLAAGLIVIITSAYFINSIIKKDHKSKTDIASKKQIVEMKEKEDNNEVIEGGLPSSENKNSKNLTKKEDISKVNVDTKENSKNTVAKVESKKQNNTDKKSEDLVIVSTENNVQENTRTMDMKLDRSLKDNQENDKSAVVSMAKNDKSFGTLQSAMAVNADKNVSIGEVISIDIEEIQDINGTWSYSIENNNIVELISYNTEVIDCKKVNMWKFRGIYEGSVNIKYQLYEDNNLDKIYETREYKINVVK